jgi:hypothetical protein
MGCRAGLIERNGVRARRAMVGTSSVDTKRRRIMDHDGGWAAQAITLISRDGKELKLPCRWVEYIQEWNDASDPPFFLVNVGDTKGLADHKWRRLAFTDVGGKTHEYEVRKVKEIKPKVVRLMKET